MKNYFPLRILDLFKSIYTSFGIDYKAMRLIIQAKLTLDSRRVSNMASNGMEEENKDKNYFYSSLMIYAILGLMSVPILFMGGDVRLRMTLYFSYIMILLLTILISDFSSVILDVDDKDIIGIRGVDLKTLNAAKTTHIFIYILMLSVALAGGGLALSLKFGIVFFLMLLLSIILIDILMIIITAIMYFVILQFFKGEKLKDMLNTFQIAFLLLFTIGYQIAIQGMNFIDVDIAYTSSWFSVLYIPMWFASNFKLIEGNRMDIISIVLSLLSIIVPIASLIIYQKFVPVFEK
ncbi:MAG: ABC transporter permease, partial [Peptostreptococcaceae bacterium]